ncbi:MAG: hypothetical protein KDB65_10845 [Calditrichaeota bacterium]|nr:hypothetical protein [Calditrichota bacterium]
MNAQTTRVLLRPPDGYRGFELDGERYVVGQIHLDQYSDTTKLKQFGFREFEVVGSDAWHKKVKAVWPLHTDVDALPESVAGLSYEKARSVEQASRAYENDRVITAEYSNSPVSYSRRFVRTKSFALRNYPSIRQTRNIQPAGERPFRTKYMSSNRSKLTMTTIGLRTIDSQRRTIDYYPR